MYDWRKPSGKADGKLATAITDVTISVGCKEQQQIKLASKYCLLSFKRTKEKKKKLREK